MRIDLAEAAIRDLPAGYRLDCVVPITPADYFRRWLFAYASIQTGWERNCLVYNRIKDLTWLWSEDELRYRMEESRAGLHNVKAANILRFARTFWADPTAFYGGKGETWTAFRNRLSTMVPGIGLAKTSFVLEMTWPRRAEVVCLDTHMRRLYGTTDRQDPAEYAAIERHWVETCRRNGRSPALARWIYWDQNQGYNSCRYWTYVFEDERHGLLGRI